MDTQSLKLLIVILAISLLSACGGGGGGSFSPTTNEVAGNNNGGGGGGNNNGGGGGGNGGGGSVSPIIGGGGDGNDDLLEDGGDNSVNLPTNEVVTDDPREDGGNNNNDLPTNEVVTVDPREDEVDNNNDLEVARAAEALAHSREFAQESQATAERVAAHPFAEQAYIAAREVNSGEEDITFRIELEGSTQVLDGEIIRFALLADSRPTVDIIVNLDFALGGEEADADAIFKGAVGYAVEDEKCQALVCAVRFPAGAASVIMTMRTLTDNDNELPPWRVIISNDFGYSVDEDSREISFQPSDPESEQPPQNQPPQVQPPPDSDQPSQNNPPDANPTPPPPESMVFAFARNLAYANLGAWFSGDVGEFDKDTVPIRFSPGAQNIVQPPSGPNSGKASYNVNADGVYKGIRFFPRGSIDANFVDGNAHGWFRTYSPKYTFYVRDQGPTEAYLIGHVDNGVPEDRGNHRRGNHRFSLTFDAQITPNGLEGGVIRSLNTWGVFEGVAPVHSPNFSVTGKFHDNPDDYDINTHIPNELSGIIEGLADAEGNKVELGFVGEYDPAFAEYIEVSAPLPYQPPERRVILHHLSPPPLQPGARRPGDFGPTITLDDLIRIYGPPLSLPPSEN